MPPPYAASTTRTSKLTFSEPLTAAKIAARLSMLGLPFEDSIRCRLLLGLCVSSARCSKPTVALTRSRKIRRAASGSPLRNSVAASSSSAFAKSGSRATRAATVCLKSRVSVSHRLNKDLHPAAEFSWRSPKAIAARLNFRIAWTGIRFGWGDVTSAHAIREKQRMRITQNSAYPPTSSV